MSQRMHPFDFMLHFCRIEEHILELKKETCTGNMLQGHVVKPIDRIDIEKCRMIMVNIQAQLSSAKWFCGEYPEESATPKVRNLTPPGSTVSVPIKGDK